MKITAETAPRDALGEAARLLDAEAEELEAGGGADIFNEDQRSIAAQTYRNAARKIRSLARQ
ncbi:hypothetical protein [Actinomadura rubrisoli]|uniref:Uncharacterized protein n=1 Tax=Actinomadura rubrisoli TaxID=2530368 RepID=A0A4V2YZR4_9ACTN|nr:hypothetical protein [Actinomadura rubrisoli]TDD97667.1 hypothetical protein E1298_01130 [Actinomadura rubrisoli]